MLKAINVPSFNFKLNRQTNSNEHVNRLCIVVLVHFFVALAVTAKSDSFIDHAKDDLQNDAMLKTKNFLDIATAPYAKGFESIKETLLGVNGKKPRNKTTTNGASKPIQAKTKDIVDCDKPIHLLVLTTNSVASNKDNEIRSTRSYVNSVDSESKIFPATSRDSNSEIEINEKMINVYSGNDSVLTKQKQKFSDPNSDTIQGNQIKLPLKLASSKQQQQQQQREQQKQEGCKEMANDLFLYSNCQRNVSTQRPAGKIKQFGEKEKQAFDLMTMRSEVLPKVDPTISLPPPPVPSKILSRSKRFLAFPEGASFSVALCMTIGIIGNPRYDLMSFGINWATAYDLPNTSWILNHLHGFSKHPVPWTVLRRRSRRALYKEIENVVDNMGYNGRDCVLRALCESRMYFTKTKMTMIGEMVRAIFSLPKQRLFTRELHENSGIEVYDRAYRKGRSLDCENVYPCEFSLLELAFGKYAKPPTDYFYQ